jgi:signal transduction histidine kinase
VDLLALAREVAAHLGVLAEEKEQALTVEASEPVLVDADRLVLRQALVNVVDNAIKYSPLGSRIRVVVTGDPATGRVDVIDRGPGIAAAHRERIFERFYRVDKGRSREQGGAGLGLSLAHWAVTAHGGRIDVESKEGEGSTFRISLPRGKPRVPDHVE